jgi:hypothetical protein
MIITRYRKNPALLEALRTDGIAIGLISPTPYIVKAGMGRLSLTNYRHFGF